MVPAIPAIHGMCWAIWGSVDVRNSVRAASAIRAPRVPNSQRRVTSMTVREKPGGGSEITSSAGRWTASCRMPSGVVIATPAPFATVARSESEVSKDSAWGCSILSRRKMLFDLRAHVRACAVADQLVPPQNIGERPVPHRIAPFDGSSEHERLAEECKAVEIVQPFHRV